jgi:hypothetical protein
MAVFNYRVKKGELRNRRIAIPRHKHMKKPTLTKAARANCGAGEADWMTAVAI